MRYIALFIALIQCCFASDITQNIKRVMIQADWIAHVVCVSNDTKYDTPHKDEKYDETKMKTIAVAISDVFTNSGAFKGKKKGDFITFNGTEPRNYTASNWNALYLWNWLFAYKNNANSNPKDLIKYTSNLIKENCKDIQNIESKISKAQSDFEYYRKELKIEEFLRLYVKNGEYGKLDISKDENNNCVRTSIAEATNEHRIQDKIKLTFSDNENYNKKVFLLKVSFGGIYLEPKMELDAGYMLYNDIKLFEPLHNITCRKNECDYPYRNRCTIVTKNKEVPTNKEKIGIFRYGECSNKYIKFETSYIMDCEGTDWNDISGFKITRDGYELIKGLPNKTITIKIPARIHKRPTRISLQGLITSLRTAMDKDPYKKASINIIFEEEKINDNEQGLLGRNSHKGEYTYSYLMYDKWSTSRIEEDTFAKCDNLQSIDMSGTITCTHKWKNFNYDNMFNGCKALKSVRLPKYQREPQPSTKDMFVNCTSLKEVYNLVELINGKKLSDIENMFIGCDDLTNINIPGYEIIRNKENKKITIRETKEEQNKKNLYDDNEYEYDSDANEDSEGDD